MVRKCIRIAGKFFIAVIGFIALYILVMFVLSLIPVGPEQEHAGGEVSIYVKSNGVHTDVVVPVTNVYKDWRGFVRPELSDQGYDHEFIGFGWGDRDFYLNTPQWSDLKVSTALHAISYTGESIMHTTFLRNIREHERCIRLDISAEQYQRLVQYIENDFLTDENGKAVMISNAAYGEDDSFYVGKGKYSMVYTCNSWTNQALKAAGQKAALWTLTDTGVLRHHLKE